MEHYDYCGVIHIHSAFSFDGHTELSEIIKAALKNRIDFLMLTDHDNLKAKEEGWEGWNNKVLLIVGQEIAPRFNHYLGFNIKRAIISREDAEDVPPQQYINQVREAGGFGFIAHPDHEGTKTFHVKHYPWTDWSVEGYAGVSIWDFMTDWQSSLKRYLPSLVSFLFPAFFLRGPKKVTLARWDALNYTKKVIGIGELDNHASIKKILGIKVSVFPFDLAFKFVRTHICTLEPLTGDGARDIRILYESLLHGRCYAAMEYFKSAKGFSFLIKQNSREYTMGDFLELKDQSEIRISVPAIASLRLIRNGICEGEQVGREIVFPLQNKGIYRAEAYLKSWGKYRPWIFSNPIFVQ